MGIDTPIVSLLGRNRRPLLSLEFFPPKTEQAAADMLRAAEEVAAGLRPDFVSITYGAGGGTRGLTYAYTQLLRQRFGWTVMPHLTCVGHSQEELLAIAESYMHLGVRNIMALRGDPPKGNTSFVPHPDGLAYASQLVTLLKQNHPQLCLGVAGYPEKHPQAPDLATDMTHLAHKVACGASFITTQLFFDNAAYSSYVASLRSLGVAVPVLPGLLPVLSLEQAQRLCSMCGTVLPLALRQRLEAVAVADQWRVGVDWAIDQAQGLIEAGVPGLHLYIMNRSPSVIRLVQGLRERGIFGAHLA